LRKVLFAVANSLDNYIARKDLQVDWILSSEESKSVLAELWKNIDTVLIGRKTYEPVLKSGKPWPTFPGVKNYVFSRTLKECPDKDVQIISEDAAAFVGKLKSGKGKDIFVLGGGELAKSLFDANLIDEISLSIHPLLLGSGIPLFLPTKRQLDLELLECKPYKNSCVLVRYRIKH